MAKVSGWNPFGVALDLTATGSNVTRTSTTEFTVQINASWSTTWNTKTNYGMDVTSGGKTITINKFENSTQTGSGSFTGTYSVSGNGSMTKTITVTFRNYNTRTGDSKTKNVTFDVTVPEWPSYTITYSANGGSGAPDNQIKWKDQPLTLSTVKPTRTGYSFLGWSTSSTATSATYAAGGSFTTNAVTTLYAVWKANTYTVSYNANGGSLGSISNQTKTYGKTLTLHTTTPTRDRYNFLGWATSSTASAAQYKAGASYTTNQAVTLYAVWELAYTPTRVTNLSIERCVKMEDGTYELSDEGNYARVTFDYESDKPLIECEFDCSSSNPSASNYYKTFDLDGTSTKGTFSEIIGDNENSDVGLLDSECTYSIEIAIMDSAFIEFEGKYGQLIIFATLPGMNLPIDVIADEIGPVGIAFGKPAELENIADFNYEIYPRKGFANILLPHKKDLNDVMEPNTYYGDNTSTYEYINCPITQGTFTLEVAAGGSSGQRVQTLTSTRKDDFVIWKRFYYTNAWGDWYQEYAAEGILLASPGLYMKADQTVTLSQNISTVPHGIVLVFSLYDAEEKVAMNQEFYSHFIHKYLIAAHSGKGHNINLCGMFGNALKYLYISDTRIAGHEKNNQEMTVDGISYTNARFVLRYVIGV